MLDIECIVHKNYGRYGLFPKQVNDYLIEYYGQEIANTILTIEEDQTSWNFCHDTQQRIPTYKPVMSLNESRFNKKLIEAVRNTENRYSISQGDLEVDDDIGYEISVRISFI